MTRRSALGLWGGLALMLVAVNVAAVRKERVLAQGDVVLLRLRPVDPRSLMQGDYMRLSLVLVDDLRRDQPDPGDASGQLVLRRDGDGVARYVRVAAPGESPGPDELLLRYTHHGYDIAAGPSAFFFPEGQGDRFARAAFAEVRLSADGEAVLVGLRDRGRLPLH
jgi:uncharacterized membrane-anchored protein